jgi:predicted DNA-binding transcriptional regulator AlpA
LRSNGFRPLDASRIGAHGGTHDTTSDRTTNDLLTVPETAEVLGKSIATTYRYISGGYLRAVQRLPNRTLLVKRESIEELLRGVDVRR